MTPQKHDLESLINILAHSGSIAILKSLKKSPKKQIEIVRETKLDKTIVWRRTKELGSYRLIEMKKSITQRQPIFKLTSFGKIVLRLIEEMEEEFKKEFSSL
ncbi:hypothetical protein DRO97_03380 [Archaeoglobales archaeon]|nr:MAG: hypothetical protein DRO97_03380 [Archaeoglobales archaeon]